MLPIQYAKPFGYEISKPVELSQMLEITEVLSRDFESVRIDLYISDGQVFVGELTHCPGQAHDRFGSLAEEELFSSYYFG